MESFSYKNCNLLPNSVKSLNKNWLEFDPFCINESKQNEVKDAIMLKSPFFYQKGHI